MTKSGLVILGVDLGLRGEGVVGLELGLGLGLVPEKLHFNVGLGLGFCFDSEGECDGAGDYDGEDLEKKPLMREERERACELRVARAQIVRCSTMEIVGERERKMETKRGEKVSVSGLKALEMAGICRRIFPGNRESKSATRR
ncbi:hypothetical protein Dimus_016755 [Dionaea muscipula]